MERRSAGQKLARNFTLSFETEQRCVQPATQNRAECPGHFPKSRAAMQAQIIENFFLLSHFERAFLGTITTYL